MCMPSPTIELPVRGCDASIQVKGVFDGALVTLERRSGISREALSRYVTTRPDRRRSPTIDTLVAIADAMHLSLEPLSLQQLLVHASGISRQEKVSA